MYPDQVTPWTPQQLNAQFQTILNNPAVSLPMLQRTSWKHVPTNYVIAPIQHYMIPPIHNYPSEDNIG